MRGIISAPLPDGGADFGVGAAFEPDLEVAVREPFIEPLSPLHDDDGVVEIGVEVQRVELGEQVDGGVVEQPVHVDVDHRRGTREARAMHTGQHERRRDHRPFHIHRPRNPLGQHSFSRTKRTRQHNHVTGAQLAAELGAQRDGVLGGGQFGGAGAALSHVCAPGSAPAA